MRNPMRFLRALMPAAFVVTLCLGASTAQARVEMVHWLYPAQPQVAGFRLYASTTAGDYGGQPIADILFAEAGVNEKGEYFRMIELDDGTAAYVVMTAYDQTGLESLPSNELLLMPVDTDGDGVADINDAFDTNPNEWADSDGDEVGDNADAFPNNPYEVADSDGDGVGDNGDAFPANPNEWLDTDWDGVGDNSDPAPNDPEVSGPWSFVLSPYRVNAGSNSDYEDPSGRVWTRDEGFYAAGYALEAGVQTDVVGTESDGLYRAYRSDAGTGDGMTYRFPLPPGNYAVSLHFVEFDAQASERRFDVEIEGTTMMRDFDIFANAGGTNRVVVKMFQLGVVDGELDLRFIRLPNSVNPTVNAIEVVSLDSMEGEVLTSPGKPFIIEAN